MSTDPQALPDETALRAHLAALAELAGVLMFAPVAITARLLEASRARAHAAARLGEAEVAAAAAGVAARHHPEMTGRP